MPPYIKEAIQNTTIFLNDYVTDEFIWGGNLEGVYTAINQVISGSILKEREILPNLGVDFGNFMRQRRCGSSCGWRGMALSLRCRSCTGDILHSQQLAQGVVKRKKRFFIV